MAYTLRNNATAVQLSRHHFTRQGVRSSVVPFRTSLLAIAAISILLLAFACVSSALASASTAAPPWTGPAGTSKPAVTQSWLPLPVLPRTPAGQLVLNAIAVLVTLLMAPLSRQARMWYWGLFGGPVAGSLMVFQVPPHYPPAYDGLVILAFWSAPFVAERVIPSGIQCPLMLASASPPRTT